MPMREENVCDFLHLHIFESDITLWITGDKRIDEDISSLTNDLKEAMSMVNDLHMKKDDKTNPKDP